MMRHGFVCLALVTGLAACGGSVEECEPTVEIVDPYAGIEKRKAEMRRMSESARAYLAKEEAEREAAARERKGE